MRAPAGGTLEDRLRERAARPRNRKGAGCPVVSQFEMDRLEGPGAGTHGQMRAEHPSVSG